VTYEPPTFYELNAAAAALHDTRWRGARACRWVSGAEETVIGADEAGQEADLPAAS
jgi:hypothetical protein